MKVLVTTDFSANSKAGLRFAMQLALQNNKIALTFFHSYYLSKPTSGSDAAFAAYEKGEANKILNNLKRFVESTYKSLKIDSKNSKCVIKSSVFTDVGIREYASENKFNFICISTRGAGKIKKLLGTNTSNLINQSDVPVIAVPAKYRSKKITNILYASDLANLEKELKRVVDFAKPLKAKVELLHVNSPFEIIADTKNIDRAVKNISKYAVNLHFENLNPIQSLLSVIETAIGKSKPSMMIMFTQQDRSFYEKLFLSSKSAEYSFHAKVPLLVFNKA